MRVAVRALAARASLGAARSRAEAPAAPAAADVAHHQLLRDQAQVRMKAELYIPYGEVSLTFQSK